jgi:hypothetical protein
MNQTLFAAVDTTPVPEPVSASQFRFDSRLLWLVLIVAGLFIACLILDAWLVHQRNKRLNAWSNREKGGQR